MPLFGPKASPPFEPFKSKTYLKCAKARGKQMTQKKQNENKQLAKELGGLLKTGKEEMARIRVRLVACDFQTLFSRRVSPRSHTRTRQHAPPLRRPLPPVLTNCVLG